MWYGQARILDDIYFRMRTEVTYMWKLHMKDGTELTAFSLGMKVSAWYLIWTNGYHSDPYNYSGRDVQIRVFCGRVDTY